MKSIFRSSFARTALTLVLTTPIFAAELVPDWFFTDGMEFSVSVPLMRSSTLKIRDPHFFAPVLPPFICPDFTDNDIAGQPNSAVNNQINVTLTTDGNDDGFLDSSPLWQFQNSNSALRRYDTAAGRCTTPLASTVCTVPSVSASDTYAAYDAGPDTCFSPIPGTTGGYTPAVANVPAPCFVGSAKAQAALDFNGVSVPLFGVRTGGASGASGPSGRVMMRGFLRESDANTILLPAAVPLVGGRPLSVLLKGGTGSCATGSDKDSLDGVPGWWFYIEQTIAVVAAAP
jgi:hypothetical protein